MALPPGSRLGVCEVTGQIGAGGMGELYRAIDSNLKRSVATNVLAASVPGEADRLARFSREARVKETYFRTVDGRAIGEYAKAWHHSRRGVPITIDVYEDDHELEPTPRSAVTVDFRTAVKSTASRNILARQSVAVRGLATQQSSCCGMIPGAPGPRP